MKSVFVFAFLLIICLSKSMAQSEKKTFSMGFGIEGGIPTGNAADNYQLALGLSLRFSYHLGPGFLTLTPGALLYDPKNIAGEPKKVGLQIPIRAGYKYIYKYFFAMGEVGVSEFTTYSGKNGVLISSHQTSLIMVPSVGFTYNVFEAGLRYGISTNGSGLFGARIGFNF